MVLISGSIREHLKVMSQLLLVVFTLYNFSPGTDAIFLPYWSKRNHSETSFHIPYSSLALEGGSAPGFAKKLPYYSELAKNYSLDYRCANGLPISIAWHPYSPYSIIYQTNNKGVPGLTVDGMFPGILNAAVAGCCHENTEVLFGKFLKSVRNAEKNIQADTFDLTFPLYGYDSSATSFR